MDKIADLDSSYEQFIRRLPDLLPDGIIEVDLKLLQKLGLLHDEMQNEQAASLTRFFHVVESKEKITLFNDQFAIWIVPEKIHNEPHTLVLVALNMPTRLHLEMAFSMSGIYNTSRLVLRVLEKFLAEIYNKYHVENVAAMVAVRAWYLVALRRGGRYRVNKDMRRLVGQMIWASLDAGAFASLSEPESKPKRAVLICFLFLCVFYLFLYQKKKVVETTSKQEIDN